MITLGIIGLVAFVIGGVFAAEMESGAMSIGMIIIGLFTLQYGFGIAVLAMLSSNLLLVIAGIALYGIIGGAYTAIWRWPEYIRNNKTDILTSYDKWVSRIDPADANSFDDYLNSTEYRYNAWQHKERLGTWMGMWVFSMAWELLRKPAIWFWNIMYASFGNLFQRLGKNTARKLHDNS
jgi:hypothetical protein